MLHVRTLCTIAVTWTALATLTACCSRSALRRFERDNLLQLRRLSRARHPRAQCSDGSMAGYYYRPASSHVWIVSLEGGGVCTDELSCASRCGHTGTGASVGDRDDEEQAAARILGAPVDSTMMCGSGGWPATRQGTGLLNATHPRLRDANLVLVPYCSNDGWLSSTTRYGYLFNGLDIVRGVFSELVHAHGLGSQPPQRDLVLFAAGSAGASGVAYMLDHVPEMLGAASTSSDVIGIMDSILFPIETPILRSGRVQPHQTYASLFYNSSDYLALFGDRAQLRSYAAGCVAAMPEELCTGSSYQLPFLKTPYFLAVNLNDWWFLKFALGHDGPPNGDQEHAYAQQMSRDLLDRAVQLFNGTAHRRAMWASACYQHNTIRHDAAFKAVRAGGLTMEAAIAEFIWPVPATAERAAPNHRWDGAARRAWIEECSGGFACGARAGHCYKFGVHGPSDRV